MIVYGLDSVESMLETDGYLFKLVANETAVFFFPHTSEHRDAKQPGLSYEDDSAGNALAAMVKPGRIEFRFHRAFSDERVRNLAQRIIDHPDIAFASTFAVTYQGRTLIPGIRT
jgi:hypothetical protein